MHKSNYDIIKRCINVTIVIFDSKEDLYQHVEIHSDIERNKEIANRQKESNNK